MRGYHKSSPTPRCTMKVDIMKVYDNVRWDFVLDVLRAMGFPPNLIQSVKACMTSPSFSICINESLHGYFKGARGLRQGDPMSPYLLCLLWRFWLEFWLPNLLTQTLNSTRDVRRQRLSIFVLQMT